MGVPSGSDGKESACNAGDLGLIPGSERSPGGEKSYSLQYSCLENPILVGYSPPACEKSDMTKQLTLHEVKSLSRVRLFTTPWTVAYQASPSMEFSKQEYWSGLLFPSPGDLPNTGIEPRSPALRAGALPSEPPQNLLMITITSLLIEKVVILLNHIF